MSTIIVGIILVAVVLAFILALVGFVLSRFYRKVPQSQALIINKLKSEPSVTSIRGRSPPATCSKRW